MCKIFKLFSLQITIEANSPIYFSWLFEVVSVTVALHTTHLVRHLPSCGLIERCLYRFMPAAFAIASQDIDIDDMSSNSDYDYLNLYP